MVKVISELIIYFQRLYKRLLKKCFLGSTVLWMVALLICVEIGSHFLNPLKYIDWQRVHPFQLTQAAIRYKFSELISRRAPDVLLMGSSLLMAPVYYCDGEYRATERKPFLDRPRNLGLNEFQSYTEAIYLDDLLRHQLGMHVSIFNMTLAACMISDARLLLAKIIVHSKQPQLVIYCIGPRDFIDNLMPPIGTTPTFKTLADLGDLCLLSPTSMNADIIQSLAIYSLTNYYRMREDYRSLAVECAAEIFRHPRDMNDAEEFRKNLSKLSEKGTDKAGEKAPVKETKNHTPVLYEKNSKPHVYQSLSEQLADYSHRYNPVNWQRFNMELQQLAEIIKTCKKNHIDLVIINMPITLENKLLICPDLYSRYMTEVKRLTQVEGISFVNFQDGLVGHADFLDSVHMNATGGYKFENSLSHIIVRRLRLSKKFSKLKT